ncbi:probable helicase with zinc finger domain [Euwallacea similis]|uniref:probable helicase with zinc finger domain n=1 Tax=Euwallacea similis TaxID=1736056 RepID=UPI00344ECBBF
MAEIMHFCIYCNLHFKDRNQLRAHCQTESHESVVMSDEGHDWKWRPPPRGLKCNTYVLCQNWEDLRHCRFGIQCVQAHGKEELDEWNERFRYREMKFQRAREKELLGASYTDELLEKLVQSTNPKNIMQDHISEVIVECSCPLSATVSSKNNFHNWKFKIKTYKPLKAVALLQDSFRMYFHISCIMVNDTKVQLVNNQEWISPLSLRDMTRLFEYSVIVTFKANVFGTFHQSIVFDFNMEPVLVKHLCVDLIPDCEVEGINEIRKGITLSIAERWTPDNCIIEHFQSDSLKPSKSLEFENMLKSIYPCPQAGTFNLSHSTIADKKFTRHNYRDRMHQLLFVEEMARYGLVSRYNFSTKMKITRSYILSPNGIAASTAKYSIDDELFARIELGRDLSEDTSEGRLILMHCNYVFLKPSHMDTPGSNCKVYEAQIEDKGKHTIYLRLSSNTVKELELKPDSEIEVKIQFHLNRLPYCELHYILDQIGNFKILFPDTYIEPTIPWSPSRQWSRNLDSRLNVKQREAVIAITTPLEVALPPILVIGPFGTGKTFTLAQAIGILIKDPSNRILLCTHSNSAADLYIREYFNTWYEEGEKNARPLRIYYEKRWVTTVNPTVQKYCLIEETAGKRSFRYPSLDDLVKHRIIVVTFSTSVYLSSIGLPQSFFTHILLDEAAQALECETIIPLALANPQTRIVLAGDHIQIGPDVFSPFAKERNLHISLLERLYDHYHKQFSCKILLCENYRSHESIIQFASESFYDQKLLSSSKQPRHSDFYPLTFLTTRGEDIQDKNSTAFYNNSEVYEVVECISNLKLTWPEEWGKFTDQSIGVVTPYADQVFRIRSELRKKRIDNVCVERVLNVQGKQFRVIMLSTVRTRKTCTSGQTDDADYGFLSNAKLLNTAITRSQSLVVVVGDPVALCSVGLCSKVWERYIELCNENKSFFGMTWTQLRFQLDSIELKKIYTLNPLAPEFYPRNYVQPQQCVPNLHSPQRLPAMHQSYLPMSPVILQYRPPFAPLVYQRHTSPLLLRPSAVVTHPLAVVQNSVSNAQKLNIMHHPAMNPVLEQNNATHLRKSSTANTGNNLIQFMNNVHFPEVTSFSDCINLLPHNTSLAEMLLQPQSMQERWYNYLKESNGLEAAEKFRYLLKTTNQKGSKVADKTVFECVTPQSCDSPTFHWFDSPNNQLNLNKSVYIQSDHSIGNDHNIQKPGTRKLEDNDSIVNSVLELDDDGLQKRLKEEIANLSVNCNDENKMPVADKFNGNQPVTVDGPKFHKYFHGN